MTQDPTVPHQTTPARVPSPLDRDFLTDPYPALDAVREAGPVGHEPLTRRYYLTRHDDVDAVLRNNSYSHDPRKAAEGTAERTFLARIVDQQPSMLFLDPPDHTRLRGLVNKAFTPRAVEALRPRAQQIAGELLDAVSDAAEFDLIAALAAPFPTVVIAEMIGVDTADRGQFKQWSDEVVQVFNPFLPPDVQARMEAARQNLTTYFQRVIAERRTAPRDDLLSRLIAAQEEGDRLTDDEMVTMLQLLLVAGNVTTTDLIGNGVYALLTHPDQMDKLRQDPSLIGNAVEEMLRYDSPVVETGRIPLEDVDFGGCPIAARQSITPSLGAANHDPAAYPEPDRFDITRADTHHHSFGGGPHYCLGAPLARMEAQVAINALLARFPTLHLAAGAQPQRRLLPGFRGFVSLPVVVS
jgi:cytochrome P450